jgi:hypothetical protein
MEKNLKKENNDKDIHSDNPLEKNNYNYINNNNSNKANKLIERSESSSPNNNENNNPTIKNEIAE